MVATFTGNLWQLRCLAGLFAIYLLLNHRYFIDQHPEQNSCQFGTVTNEDYRAMLGRAAELSRSNWARVRGNERDIDIRLKERIKDLAGENAGIYRKIAAIHAVMRHLNAHLNSVDDVFYKPWGEVFTVNDPPRSQQSIQLNYSMPSLSVGKFAIVENLERVTPSISINTNAEMKRFLGIETDGDLTVSILLMDWASSLSGKGLPPGSLSRAQVPCPPIPPIEWATSFDNWQTRIGRALD